MPLMGRRPGAHLDLSLPFPSIAPALRDLASHAIGRVASLVPGQCAVCHGWCGGRICPACLQCFAALRSRCSHCALQVQPGITLCGACLVDPPPFASAVTAVDYAYPWDGLVGRFKFAAGLDLAAAFAHCMADAHRSHDAARPDLLLPVPLGAQRLKQRGYNQAWELARRLGAIVGVHADSTLLLRVKDTPAQSTLSPEQRASNLRGAFVVEPTRRAELRGRSVAIVDDVMTTGATGAEIARTLLHAGAARVQLWVLARTPKPSER
ncbi:MAG: hypothetical protein JWP52_723 [Rhizobacter sp.]|nr:hypothetical protein [Rhizobacter sp.]